jgi:hypothetical protein
VIIDQESRYVLRLLPPHVGGTLRGEVVLGQEVHVLPSAPTPAQEELFAAACAQLADDLTLVPADGLYLHALKTAMCLDIDLGTQYAMQRGYEHKPGSGVRFSLTERAIAKLGVARLVAGSIAYPWSFSSISNAEQIAFATGAELEAFTEGALLAFLTAIKNGDDCKARVLRGATAEEVLAARALDVRPRR